MNFTNLLHYFFKRHIDRSLFSYPVEFTSCLTDEVVNSRISAGVVIWWSFIGDGFDLGVLVFNGNKIAFVIDTAVSYAQKNFGRGNALKINKAFVTH